MLLNGSRVEQSGQAAATFAGEKFLPGGEVLSAEVLLGQQPVHALLRPVARHVLAYVLMPAI